MSLMHHAIKNRIRDGWIREKTVPVVRGVLACQQQRSRSHAPVGNIEQDLCCGWGHFPDSKVIKDQQVGFVKGRFEPDAGENFCA